MALLKSCNNVCYTVCRSNISDSNRRNSNWKPPEVAVVPNVHLPMQSFEMKNRKSIEDIKCLRLTIVIKTPYLPNGRFDLEACDDLVNTQIENSVEGIIVGA